jgi:hypothetical protein
MGMKLGDVGTIIEVALKDSDGKSVDLTYANSAGIRFVPPSGVAFTRVCEFVGERVNGRIGYIIESGDITEVGMYSYETFVNFSDGSYFTSTEGDFEVEKTLV